MVNDTTKDFSLTGYRVGIMLPKKKKRFVLGAAGGNHKLAVVANVRYYYYRNLEVIHETGTEINKN